MLLLQLAAGVIVASGTLGQLIPPSIVLVVLADQLSIPVGTLFIGSIVPGIMMASVFALHVVIIAMIRPDIAPAIPKEERSIGIKTLAKQVIQAMLPPLLLIFLVNIRLRVDDLLYFNCVLMKSREYFYDFVRFELLFNLPLQF